MFFQGRRLDKNIRATDIEPGLANTEFSSLRFKGDTDKADSFYDGIEPLTANDIADAIFWAASRPANVNNNRIEMMAACQAFSPFNIVRK